MRPHPHHPRRSALLRVAALAILPLQLCLVHAAVAQTSPPAYYFAEFDLKDPEAMKPYAQNVTKTAAAYGGVYLAQGGRTDALEGPPPTRIILMKFKSMADARRWYDSPEYAAIRPFRQKAGVTRNFLVEGLE